MKIIIPGAGTPVRPGKLLCIGRNYARHAIEMEREVPIEMEREVPSEPLVFLKPATALVHSGGTVVLPPQSREVHHEVELVALIGRGGRHLPRGEALAHVAGYAVGLDMTARDVQAAAKKKGHPWSVAKGFDTFAPLGSFVAASDMRDVQDLEISLAVNGETRQRGRTRDMLFPVAELVAYCPTTFTLEPGALLFTGTPEGVGPVEQGDRHEAEATGPPPLNVTVRRQA